MTQQPMSRRTALEALAASGLAASLAPGGQANEETIDAGLVTEPGGSHVNLFLKALARCRGVGKVAISDPSGETFEQARRLLGDRFDRSFRDSHEMLQKFQPALTVITLEACNTPPAIVAALQAKSHVLTEKPGCTDVDRFAPLVPLAREHERHLMMALATRASSAAGHAKQLIRDGLLGTPYSTTMDWIADQTRLKSHRYQQSWLSSKDRAGGGKLIFHGIHYLDLIQFLTGDHIEVVSAFCENVGGQPIEVEDAAVLSFRLRNGMVGTLNTGYYLDRGYQNQVRVWGSQGWFHLDLPSGQPMQWYSNHSSAPEGIQEFDYSADAPLYDAFLQQAVDASLGRRPPPIRAEECLHVLKVIFAAYESAATGRSQKVI